jgi:SAM-dependent methyltransferase
MSPFVPVSTALAQHLRCPATYAERLSVRGRAVECGDCGRRWPQTHGVLDLLADGASRPVPAQRVMESTIYSLGYETLFRPRLTRIVTRQGIPDAIDLHRAMLRLRGVSTVLDVACGTGNFTRAIAAEAPDALVIGVDRSWPMLREAARLAPGGDWVRCDAVQLPFRDASMDRVHCSGALHLFDDVDAVLREFHRVLRPDGRLVVGTFVEASNARIRRLQRFNERWSGFRFFGQQALRALLSTTGWVCEEEVFEDAAISFAARRAS